MKDNIKSTLQQLVDLRQEKNEKQQVIKRLEEHLARMEVAGYTEVDSVVGGAGGIQHFRIEGFPYPEYSRKKTQLQRRVLNLKAIEQKIEEQIVMAESFINSVQDSQMRRMLTYRYVEGLTWPEVAVKMGIKYTENSCKKANERFFKNF